MYVHHEVRAACDSTEAILSKPGLSHFYNWQYFQHNMYVIFVVKKCINIEWYKRYGNLRAWTSNDIENFYCHFFFAKIFRNYMMQNKFYVSVVYCLYENDKFIRINKVWAMKVWHVRWGIKLLTFMRDTLAT